MADEIEETPSPDSENVDSKILDMLGDEPEDAPAPAAAPATPAPEKPADASEAPAEEEKPAEETTAEEQPTATPDANEKRIEGMSKALQQVQQTMASLERKLEEKGTLTPKQQQQLEQAQQQAAAIEDELKDIQTIAGRDPKDGDVYAENPKLAKTMLRLAERQTTLEKQNAELRRQLAERPQPEEKPDAVWDAETKAHPGVDVKKVFADAVTEVEQRPALKRAAAMVKQNRLDQAEYDQMLREEASFLYHDRVKAAKPNEPAPKPATPAPSPKTPTTARRVPPKTPNGARVTVDTGAPSPGASMTDDERELHLINKYLAD